MVGFADKSRKCNTKVREKIIHNIPQVKEPQHFLLQELKARFIFSGKYSAGQIFGME